jgi:hypothetical protein
VASDAKSRFELSTIDGALYVRATQVGDVSVVVRV